MTTEKIAQALQALKDAGFAARRGYPATKMPDISTPVVCICIGQGEAEQVSLEATVFCPAEVGGTVCEDRALEVAKVLKSIGAQYRVGKCGFSGKSGLFSVTVLAQWSKPAAEPATPIPPTVLMNGAKLPYATSFQVERSAQVTSVGATSGIWEVTVEELIPVSKIPYSVPDSDFSLSVRRSGKTETYSDCLLETLLRRETSDGFYQKRVAKTWSDPTVS